MVNFYLQIFLNLPYSQKFFLKIPPWPKKPLLDPKIPPWPKKTLLTSTLVDFHCLRGSAQRCLRRATCRWFRTQSAALFLLLLGRSSGTWTDGLFWRSLTRLRFVASWWRSLTRLWLVTLGRSCGAVAMLAAWSCGSLARSLAPTVVLFLVLLEIQWEICIGFALVIFDVAAVLARVSGWWTLKRREEN